RRRRFSAPQSQRINGAGTVTHNGQIIRNSFDFFAFQMMKCETAVLNGCFDSAPERDLNSKIFLSHLPNMSASQPLFRKFHLVTINNLLFEKPVFIAYSHTVSRQI